MDVEVNVLCLVMGVRNELRRCSEVEVEDERREIGRRKKSIEEEKLHQNKWVGPL